MKPTPQDTHDMMEAGFHAFEVGSRLKVQPSVVYQNRVMRPNIGPDYVFVAEYNGGWLPSRGAHPYSIGSMDWQGQVYDTPISAMAAGHLADWGRA